MPVAIALSNSPIVSPSQIPKLLLPPFFCKPSCLSSSPVNHASLYVSPSSLSPSPSPLSLALSYNGNLSEKEDELPTSSPSTLLNRKRPARITIPIVSLSLDDLDQIPSYENRLDDVEGEGEGYSVFSKRGKRGRAMEDRFSAVIGDVNNRFKQAFFGVFDGHGGANAAEFAGMNLGHNIINEAALRSEEGLEEAVREGYLTTDSEFLKQDVNGGSCSVTALIQNGQVIVSNAGDCRAVLSRGGVAEALTDDHRPSRQDEMERIQSLGGYVDCCRGVWRIQGSLAVSRGIGDSHLKRWVIAEPETKRLTIEPECEFLIMASDGLWDKVGNQEAVEVVRPLIIGVDKPEPLSACKKLVDLALMSGSSDDITIMVVQLSQFAQ